MKSSKPKAAKAPPKVPAAAAAAFVDDNSDDNENVVVTENAKKKKKLSVERIYQKKSQLEHILLRPDTYIGSVEKVTQVKLVNAAI